jgi:hypothetical protein
LGGVGDRAEPLRHFGDVLEYFSPARVAVGCAVDP